MLSYCLLRSLHVQVRKVLRVIPETLVPKAPRVLLVLLAMRVTPVTLAHKALPVQRVLLVLLAIPVPLAHKALRGLLVSKAFLVLMEFLLPYRLIKGMVRGASLAERCLHQLERVTPLESRSQTGRNLM